MQLRIVSSAEIERNPRLALSAGNYVLQGGPGLRYLNETEAWYGSFGGCNVCSAHGDSLVPRQCRWWGPDDGWKVGVLCRDCADDVRDRGPRGGDYAYRGISRANERAENIDLIAELSADLDGAAVDAEELA